MKTFLIAEACDNHLGSLENAKKLAEKVAKAEGKLATARNDALVNLNSVAAEAALSAVAKLADIKITAAQASKTTDKLAASIDNQEAN